MLIDSATQAAVIGVLILVAFAVWGLVNLITNKYPSLSALKAAIAPEILKGLSVAKSLSISLTALGQNALTPAQENAIADSMYDKLPATIWLGKVPISLAMFKLLVSRTLFETWVDDFLAEAESLLGQYSATFQKQIDAFSAQVAGSSTSPTTTSASKVASPTAGG